MSNAPPQPPPYSPYATQPSAPTLPPGAEAPYSYQQGGGNPGFQYSDPASQPQPPYHVPGSAPYPVPPNYNTATGAYPGQNGTTDNVNPGGAALQTDTESNDWNVDAFSDKNIRRGFIRKVYLILMVQLSFTFGIICLFMFYHPIKHWLQTGANQAVYWVSYGVFLVTYIILICCPTVRRKVPGNYICLAIFTIALTYMTATLSSFHDTYIVMVAIGITAAVCLAISIFAIQTKIDFTMCFGLLFVLCMVVMFFGFAVFITYLATRDSFTLYVMNCVYGGLAALLFGLFLAYDTQQVIGGRKYQLSPEEYISGALQLYLDVVYLFVIILGLFGGKR